MVGRFKDVMVLTIDKVDPLKMVAKKYGLTNKVIAKNSGLSSTFVSDVLGRGRNRASVLHYNRLSDYLLSLDKIRESVPKPKVASLDVSTPSNYDAAVNLLIKDLYTLMGIIKTVSEDVRLYLAQVYPDVKEQ
jgi:hypothetical protein